jgi:beta-glucanase (GH16 family)
MKKANTIILCLGIIALLVGCGHDKAAIDNSLESSILENLSTDSQTSDTSPLVTMIGIKADQVPFFDDFDGDVDESVWQKGIYTFDGNGSVFSPEQVVQEDGLVILRIDPLDTPDQGRNYVSGQLQSIRFFSYGTFTVRMRSSIPTGTVSSFFLMNQWQSGHWLHKEIDIEFLGKAPKAVQYNVHKFYGDTESAAGDPHMQELLFDIGDSFHDYGIIWGPDKIEWTVDGETVYTYDQNIPDEPMNIFINYWVADPNDFGSTDWLGELNESDLPSMVEYEWVKYEPLFPGEAGTNTN